MGQFLSTISTIGLGNKNAQRQVDADEIHRKEILIQNEIAVQFIGWPEFGICTKFGNENGNGNSSVQIQQRKILIDNEILAEVIAFLSRLQLGTGFSLVDRRHNALSYHKMHKLEPHWVEQTFLCGIDEQKAIFLIKKGAAWICLPLFPDGPLPERILGFRSIVLKDELTDQMVDFLRIHSVGAQLEIDEIMELFKYDCDKAEHFLPKGIDEKLFSLFQRLRIANFVGHFLVGDLLKKEEIRRMEWLQMARWDDALAEWLLQEDGRCRKLTVQEWNSFGDFPPEFHNAAVKNLCAGSNCRFLIKFFNDSRFPVTESMDFVNGANGECIRSIQNGEVVFVVRCGQNEMMAKEKLEAIFGENEKECLRVIAGQRNGNGSPFKLSFARH